MIRYWDDYNLDELKNNALQGLLGLISTKDPEMWGWIPKTWVDLKSSSDHISRWIHKLINGDREIGGRGCTPLVGMNPYLRGWNC